MHVTDREQLEQEIQELCKQGEIHLAVDRIMRGYGQDIRRMMSSVLPDDERAHDAYGLFSERLLKGLKNFRWESSLRTWAYRMARNACLKLVSGASARELPVTRSAIPEHSVRQRSATNPWQRTDVKDRFRALRKSLDPLDQKLLELRLDQNLPWQEVARAMATPEEPLTGETLARRATAMRQQFQRIKARLRTLAVRDGLVKNEDEDD
ncbi:sigma-70 family RNA polymerase sigma factor [Archangium sp.]|jgi:RNA polymerase sigma-70 factor (ECF subfamily)|uniref:RNA polymerase sigma factor n=1 Tax=Archangium sp. TaxID=1872627 RepID=UPI002EDB4DAB